MTARRRREDRTFLQRGEDMSQPEDFHQRIRALEARDEYETYHIKLNSDRQVVTIQDGLYYWGIPEDIDGMFLNKVGANVSTPSSSGDVEIQIRNVTQALNMLSGHIFIESGDNNSRYAASQPVVNPSNAEVDWGDQIRFDILDDGTGAKGLDVVLYFR